MMYRMNLHDLKMCLERHATSKINDGDLMHINSFGFRGDINFYWIYS